MSARLARLEALLERVQRRMVESRAEGGDTLEMADGPLSLDSPSVIPASVEPDSLDVPLSGGALSEPALSAPAVSQSASSQSALSTSDMSEPALSGPPAIEVTEVELDDDIPESGPFSSARDADGSDVDGPITPPPESVEEEIPTLGRGQFSQAPAQHERGPTMEQVGQTVDLAEGEPGSTLELDEPNLEAVEEELGMSSAPSLEAGASAARDETPQPSSVAEMQPHVVARPQTPGTPISVEGTRPEQDTPTFLELLDRSLGLD